jgi:hypothetical protein
MPQDPSSSFTPDVEIDDSQKWILRLHDLEEQESLYRDRNPNAMRMVWKWHIYNPSTGEAVMNNGTGEVFDLWHFTADTTFPFNPKTGRMGEAREVADALVGHRLTDDEIRAMNEDGWEVSLIGKTVLADLEWFTTKTGNQRLKVLRFKPYKQEPRKKVGASRRLLDDADDEADE